MDNVTPIEALQRKREFSMTRPVRDLALPTPKRDELCPTCKFPLADTAYGWIRAGFDEDKKKTILQPCPTCSGGVEAKRSAQLINDLFGDSHIPFYAKDWSFTSFPKSSDQQAMLAVKEFTLLNLAERAEKRGLYLVGDKGRGKTSLAISALQYVLKRGHSGVFITTVELFQILKDAIAASIRIERGDKRVSRDTGREEMYEDVYESSKGAKLLRLIKSVEWLVLDDLGVENGSKYVIQQLYLILEQRRSQGLRTIFTSNRDADDLAIYWKSKDEGVFDDSRRIIDRLGEYCLTVSVSGNNQRMRAGES